MDYIDIDKVKVGDHVRHAGLWCSVVAMAIGSEKVALELREIEPLSTFIVEYDIRKGDVTMTQVLVKRSHAD